VGPTGVLNSAIEQLALHYRAPALVYFERILEENLRHFLRLTGPVPRRQCLYSVKAATSPSVLKTFLRAGISGFDASSATEAALVHRMFGSRASLFVTAPAMTLDDLETLLRCQPAAVHLDSLPSLELFLQHGNQLPMVGIRINPGVSFSRHALHDSAGPSCRLGLPLAELGEALALCRRYGRDRIGLHFHVSCESPSFAPQTAALRLLTEALIPHAASGPAIAHLDLGGGILPPRWDFTHDRLISDMPDDAAVELGSAVTAFMATAATTKDFAVFFEPGDALVCSAAVLMARALERRTTPDGQEHVVLDTNINHFPNLLQYGSQPEILPDTTAPGPHRVIVSGNSCLGGDRIAEANVAADAPLRYFTFTDRGSYELSKFNFFNGRFRPDLYMLEASGALRSLKQDSVDDLVGFWKESAAVFPTGHESFLRYEEIAREERGLYLYHPDLRHISAFELDPDDFPLPGEIRQAVLENFGHATTTYGRSLGHRDVRERIAAFENGIVGRDLYAFTHTAVTLGAANAVWLVLNALLRGGMRRLVIDAPNFFLYAFGASQLGIPWSNVHRSAPAGSPAGLVYEPDALLTGVHEIVAALDRTPEIGAFALSEPGLPHGCRRPEGDIRLLAEKARTQGWVLIVDETLGDINFDGSQGPDWSWLDHSYPVIRIKSVSKTFGLAGLRLGYLCVTEAARWAVPNGTDLMSRMADLSDTAYSSPPSFSGPALCASLDLLEHYREGRSTPGTVQLAANFAKLQRRLDTVRQVLGAAGIHHVVPRSGSSIMTVLHKLVRPESDSIPFFRALVREHSLFLELGPLFSQNPAWDFTVARLGLGRREREFHEDLQRFSRFYADYQPGDGPRTARVPSARTASDRTTARVTAASPAPRDEIDSTPPLHLPLPSLLAKVERGSTCDDATWAGGVLARHAPGAPVETVIASLNPLTERILSSWKVPTAPATPPLSEAQQEYDRYFRVRRLDVSPVVAHCQAAVVAYDRFLRDSLRGHSLQIDEIGRICSALESILCAHAAPEEEQDVADQAPPAWSPIPGAVDPLARWRCGHGVFFVLAQRLIVVHGWLQRALEQHDMHAAAEALHTSSELWWASAAAFKYTADFPPDDYARLVRPSMSPPYVSDGFSGLSSPDHAALLQRLRVTQPLLQPLPSALRHAHRRYLWAMNAAYDSHAYVCECFVSEGASLRNPQSSATVVLRTHLKARTLRLSGAPPARSPHSPGEPHPREAQAVAAENRS
jgi:diaminopimelate decarboxylase/aspartate/methionine/tyrosine aminotransferase